jgi:hypothetical protein
MGNKERILKIVNKISHMSREQGMYAEHAHRHPEDFESLENKIDKELLSLCTKKFDLSSFKYFLAVFQEQLYLLAISLLFIIFFHIVLNEIF